MHGYSKYCIFNTEDVLREKKRAVGRGRKIRGLHRLMCVFLDHWDSTVTVLFVVK